MGDRRAQDADKKLRQEMQRMANQSGRQIIIDQDEKESKRQIKLILDQGITWEQGKELGYFHKTAKFIKLNQLGQAYAGQLTLDQQGGSASSHAGPSQIARPTPQAGPSQRQRADSDDDYSAYHTPRGEITPRGQDYPTSNTSALENYAYLLGLQANMRNYSEFELLNYMHIDSTPYTGSEHDLVLQFLRNQEQLAKNKGLIISNANTGKYDQVSLRGYAFYKDAMASRATSAPVIPPPSTSTPYTITNAEGAFDSFQKRIFGKTKETEDRENDLNARKNYEAEIKKRLDSLESTNQTLLKDSRIIRGATNLYEITTSDFNKLTKKLHDKISFDTAVLMDSRLYLHGLIEKGTNEKMNKILRNVMNYCIIPPIPRGKIFGDFDSKTQDLYQIAYDATNFIDATLKYADKLNYVNLGNIKETMKNWRIWYNDQDDADDKKYKGFDISEYIIRTGNLPTTLNVESGQAIEPVQSYGTTYRINFYYPNPWEASGTIKYFDVVLA